MSISVDKEIYQRRIRRLYSEWKEPSSQYDTALTAVKCFLVPVGTTEELLYSKCCSLQQWLFGYELTDTIALFTQEVIYFLTSKKKLEFLKPLEQNKGGDGIPEIKLIPRNRHDKDMKNFKTLIEHMKSVAKDNKIGVFPKDVFPGEFCDGWRSVMKEENFEQVDITASMAYILSVKEENEISMIRKAAVATTDLFNKYLKDQIMNIVDADKKVKHNKISFGVDEAMINPKYVTNVDPTLLEMCYPPIIQSGGNYNLKYSVESDKNYLHFGVILCSLGTRYKSYCSNLSRTLLVNPNEEIEKNYNILLTIEDKLYSLMRPETKLCDVYEEIMAFVKEQYPHLLDNLHKSFGSATGLEFRENSIGISPKCEVVLKKNMVFNLHVGLTNLVNREANDAQNKTYALLVGDTAVINDTPPATPLTMSKKRVKHIGIFIKGDSEEEEEVKVTKEVQNTNLLGRSKRNAVLDNKLRQETNTEEKRRQHQKELAQRLNEVARERIAKQGDAKEVEKVRRNTVSYKSINQLPREPEVKDLKLFVDKKHETVIMPVFGLPVPFHISTIKNISQSVEGEYTYLRINFFHPGATMGRNEGGSYPQPEATFVKELTYRASNVKEYGAAVAASNNLNNVFRLIKEVQKRFKMREAEEREKEDLVKQDTLIVSANKSNPKLKDLFIRPNIVSKRMTGSLEAHSNGFRYTSVRGDKVDILYNNIKSAFFQPCDNELLILLHFHLKHAILFGKKKHLDVQFFTEVGEITTDLGKHQHMHDRDDLAAEQAERELRHKLKSAFKGFCEKVENMTRQQIEFDTPFRELGFPGAPYRSTVTLQPTSGSLVNLTEWPPFVITLDDVELVHFERVQFHLRNFDMVFVFKDYSQKVSSVNAIPMNMLDHVKEWLNSCDIRYSEGVQSLNWAKIMKTITDDPQGFFDQGGWTFLDPESESEGDNESAESEEDEIYQPTDVESEEESDEDDSEFSEASEDESEDSEELGSDEESGKDWSDLEREAAEEDRKDELNITDKRDHNGAHKKSSHKRLGRQSNHHNNRHRYGSSLQGLSNGSSAKAHSEKRRDKHHRETSMRHNSSKSSSNKSNHKRSHDDSGHSQHKAKKSRR